MPSLPVPTLREAGILSVRVSPIRPPSSAYSPARPIFYYSLAGSGDPGLYSGPPLISFFLHNTRPMSLERARKSVQRLHEIAAGALRLSAPSLAIDPAQALQLFESQLLCRLIDVESHELRARGEGYYTICSAGHEGNAPLGRLTRTADPALLHYRSGAFYLERARQAAVDGVEDLLLSLTASADDPISGGRHKVFGSVPLGIPPQTSTIASHLPKAVGMAVAIERST